MIEFGAAQTVDFKALRDVVSLPQTNLVKASSLYRSAPYEAQGPDFINAVVLVQTQLTPLALLQALQALPDNPYKQALMSLAQQLTLRQS